MGYGIKIKLGNQTFETTYISYNWSDFSDYWHVSKDVSRLKGFVVALKGRIALEKIKNDKNITPSIPDPENYNWGYGLRNDTEDMNESERLGVFAYHIERFIKLGEQYNDCFFFTDHDTDSDYSEDDTSSSEQETNNIKDEDESFIVSLYYSFIRSNRLTSNDLPFFNITSKGICSSIMHPINGGPMKIDS